MYREFLKKHVLQITWSVFEKKIREWVCLEEKTTATLVAWLSSMLWSFTVCLEFSFHNLAGDRQADDCNQWSPNHWQPRLLLLEPGG